MLNLAQVIKRLPLLLIILVFIALKIQHLNYPFYWDESWSYAPGLKLMYLHGPSLMPDAIDVFYSRGHPLFFYAATAGWMRIFGSSHFAMHCFALFVSVCLLIAIYEISLRLFRKEVAVLATALMAVQVAFFVQASYLLPEVMVALWVLLSLYFFTRERYLPLVLSLTALLLTKETGATLGLVLGAAATIGLFDPARPLKNRLFLFGAVLIPGLLLGLFFLLQHHLLGWYFYPEHMGYIDFEWSVVYNKLKNSIIFLAMRDERRLLVWFIAILAVITAICKRKWQYAIPAFCAATLFIFINHNLAAGSHGTVRLSLFILSLLAGAYFLYKSQFPAPGASRRFFWLGLFFAGIYVAFSCINFFTFRYLLAPLAVIAVLGTALTAEYSRRIGKNAIYIAGTVALLISLSAYRHDDGLGDVSMASFNAMRVQQKTVDFLEKNHYYKNRLGSESFQDREHLLKPYTGYLSAADTFKDVRWDIDSSTALCLFNNIEPDARYQAIAADTINFKRIFRTSSKGAWAEIYWNKRVPLK